jgi:hypothetical protein
MKKSLITLLLMGLFASPSFAKKPEWAGKGKPDKEQLEAHKEAIKDRADVEDRVNEYGDEEKNKVKKEYKEKKSKKERDDNHDELEDEHKEKKAKKEHEDKKNKGKEKHDIDELEDEASKGLEKQGMKKSEQVQKEIGKGSETGQDSRETRKKWWKFWGE